LVLGGNLPSGDHEEWEDHLRYKIALVGEAYGEAEEKAQTPFVGFSGQELTRMLEDAGIHRADCFLTNVFNLHPPGNQVEFFCGPKDEAISGYPALVKSKYVRVEFIPELERLGTELSDINPNIIVALGNTASWALLGRTSISKYRGTTELSTHTATGYKVLPTYHPAAVCRQWELRPTTVMDLMKAARESAFPEIRRPSVSVHIPETIEDLHAFHSLYIRGCRSLAVDIETAGQQITCIGFAPSIEYALVVPIFDRRRTERSYWPDLVTEGKAWRFIRELLLDRAIPKVMQNGMYDVAFLWRSYGLKVMNAEHDTMLLHHALQPESLKGLGYLGSVYTDHGSWKQMREKVTTIKRDE
jgi:uracil-DNA glycosylase